MPPINAIALYAAFTVQLRIEEIGLGEEEMNCKIPLSTVALSTALGCIPALAPAQPSSAPQKTRGQCHQEALVKYPNPRTREHQDAMARCMAEKKV